MAPRRGGGGGGSFDIDSVTCSRYAFESVTSRVRIAFLAIFFVVYLVLCCVAGGKYFRSRDKNRALRRWWALALSMIFGLISIIINIIALSLLECSIGDRYRLLESGIGMTWLFGLSVYLMVAVVMVPIIRRLYDGAGRTAKTVTIIHTVYLVLLAIIFVCWMGIYTYLTHEQYTNSHSLLSTSLLLHYYRLSVAFYALAAIGIIMAGINMVMLLVRRKSSHWRLSMKARILLLPVMALGMTLVELGSYVVSFYGANYSDYNYVNESTSARIFLQFFFYSCSFAIALSIAASRQLPGDAAPTYQPPVDTAAHFQQPYEAVPAPQAYSSPRYQHQPQWNAQSPQGGY